MYSIRTFVWKHSAITGLTPKPCDWIFRLHWFVGNSDKKPMILCACSTSRSCEQSTKHHWGKNMRKFCLFYRQNNKSMIIKHGRHLFWEIHEVRKRFVGFLFLIVLSRCWLAGQANSNHVVLEHCDNTYPACLDVHCIHVDFIVYSHIYLSLRPQLLNIMSKLLNHMHNFSLLVSMVRFSPFVFW